MRITTDLVLKSLVIIAVVMACISAVRHYTYIFELCEPYKDMKLADMPAKCVDYYTPKRPETVVMR